MFTYKRFFQGKQLRIVKCLTKVTLTGIFFQTPFPVWIPILVLTVTRTGVFDVNEVHVMNLSLVVCEIGHD